MSGGNIDFIFNLWAASLAAHNDTPRFANHTEMYNTIDSTPIGDVLGVGDYRLCLALFGLDHR